MKNLSIKVRIALWYSLVMVVIGIIISSVVIVSYRTLTDNDTKRMLTARVNENIEAIKMRDGELVLGRSFRTFDEGVHISIYFENGTPYAVELPPVLENELLPELNDNTVTAATYDGQEYYIYDKLVSFGADGNLWVRGIVSRVSANGIISFTLLTNLVIVLLLIMVAEFGGYVLLKQLLSPVDKITNTANKIMENNDLSERIGIGEGHDEIHNLAVTIDNLLDKLEQNFEAEKHFTSDASHELRTPVSVIMAECEYMQSCELSEDEMKEAVSDIKEQAARMSKMISELLTMSRMDRGVQRKTVENVNLSELTELICNDQEAININSSIRIEKSIKDGVFANTDSELVSRVLINLIGNAYKYGKEGGYIRVGLSDTEESAIFTVKDDGIGISADNIDKIWDRFYRVDTIRSKTDNDSTGLGLSMVKEISKMLDGDVKVESTLGEGSTFTFKITKNL